MTGSALMTQGCFNQEVFQGLGSIPEASFEPGPPGTNEDVLWLPRQQLLSCMRQLQAHYPFLMDVCGVDFPERSPRFVVVYTPS